MFAPPEGTEGRAALADYTPYETSDKADPPPFENVTVAMYSTGTPNKGFPYRGAIVSFTNSSDKDVTVLPSTISALCDGPRTGKSETSQTMVIRKHTSTTHILDIDCPGATTLINATATVNLQQ